VNTGAPLTGSRVLVLGLGRFEGGVGVVRHLVGQGAQVRVCDQAPAAELAESLRQLADLPPGRLDLRLGTQEPEVLQGIERMVVNPAIPPGHALLAQARARGIAATQELNLFLKSYPGPVLGITGTNGKSTTTALVHEALHGGGVRHIWGGNIGRSLFASQGEWSATQSAVVEVSSYQLERLHWDDCGFHGGIYTYVTEDHVDRHGSVAAYRAAKAQLAATLRSHPALGAPFLVRNLADPVSLAFPAASGTREVGYGAGVPERDQVGWDGGYLTVEPGAWLLSGRARQCLLPATALALPGSFNRANAAGAIAAAILLGAHPVLAALAMARFRGLPHRLAPLGTVRGVRVLDNGVSTVPESTVSALDALDGCVHWVGGGRPKALDLLPLADALRRRATTAHVFGEAAPAVLRLLRQHAPALPARHAASVEAAMDAALGAARPGDTILFSPAFSSFDQFHNFRERAERVAAWFHRLPRDAGGAQSS
jgi:UDP-N-acetylmuramoylalanine--D-glutamate ligase